MSIDYNKKLQIIIPLKIDKNKCEYFINNLCQCYINDEKFHCKSKAFNKCPMFPKIDWSTLMNDYSKYTRRYGKCNNCNCDFVIFWDPPALCPTCGNPTPHYPGTPGYKKPIWIEQDGSISYDESRIYQVPKKEFWYNYYPCIEQIDDYCYFNFKNHIMSKKQKQYLTNWFHHKKIIILNKFRYDSLKKLNWLL